MTNEVYVIKTTEVDRTLAFFQSLGLSFVQEQHGDGPEHYACEMDGQVFEIYPAKFAAGFPAQGRFHGVAKPT